MVRLVDIAQQAGVSVMTVSRVLRDSPDIAAATKARVRAIAQQMGYVPDVMAQGLRTRCTRLFGVLVPALADPLMARVLAAIEEQSHELGYDLIVAQSLNQVDREEICLRRLLARRVEGMFVAPVYRLTPSAPIYAELQRREVKVVLLGPKAPFCSEFVNVEAEDALASYNATNHLLRLGHRRIAFLAGPPNSPAAQARFEGYRRALREANVEADDRLVFHAGATAEEGAKAIGQLLSEAVHVTAIQAVNDAVAMGAAGLLLGQGVRIPQDFSLVGFGNIPASECFRVPLTTVRQPKYRLGGAAMELMLKLIKGEAAAPRRLPADLVIRASTGLPQLQATLWPPYHPPSPPPVSSAG